MKVVINKCFGGFGLSMKGMTEYLKLKGKKCYFYKQNKFKHCDGVESHEKVSMNEKSIFVHCILKDLGKTIVGDFDEKVYGKGNYFSTYDIPRDDPDLVKVVKKLGKASWGDCAELEIVDIPDDAVWEVNEYDGNEHIAEKHRTWS